MRLQLDLELTEGQAAALVGLAATRRMPLDAMVADMLVDYVRKVIGLHVSGFLTDCTESAPNGGGTPATTVYQVYADLVRSFGGVPETQNAFGRQARQYGIEIVRQGRGIFYKLRIKDDVFDHLGRPRSAYMPAPRPLPEP